MSTTDEGQKEIKENCLLCEFCKISKGDIYGQCRCSQSMCYMDIVSQKDKCYYFSKDEE